MNENQQETELKLSKSQLQSVINTHIVEGDGLNELFNMMLNGLMYSERKVFLSDDQSDGNKGNGYRFASKSWIGSKLQLKIPRDRLGMFRPVILGLLNEQEEQVKDLCFELYGKGLTTRQIESVISKIYGASYSKSSISFFKEIKNIAKFNFIYDFTIFVCLFFVLLNSEKWINHLFQCYYC